MDWLEKAKQNTILNLEKIQEIIQKRYEYCEKVEKISGICQNLDNERLTKLFSKVNLFLEEWQNGPTINLNSPAQIISEARRIEEEIDKLLKEINEEINKELFPC